MELNSKGLHQSSGKEKESCCLLFRSSTKREIRQLHVFCLATTAGKCTKKRDALAKLLFCLSKPIAFLPFSLPSPSLLRKLPIRGVYTREKPRLTLAAAYIRRERNHLHVYEYGLRKMGTALVNGSHLSSRQDRSIDDVVCFCASGNFQQWLERRKCERIGFGQENRHILHCSFRFNLIF